MMITWQGKSKESKVKKNGGRFITLLMWVYYPSLLLFIILKCWFTILDCPLEYSMAIQAHIPLELAAVHNFICIHDEDEILEFEYLEDRDPGWSAWIWQAGRWATKLCWEIMLKAEMGWYCTGCYVLDDSFFFYFILQLYDSVVPFLSILFYGILQLLYIL